MKGNRKAPERVNSADDWPTDGGDSRNVYPSFRYLGTNDTSIDSDSAERTLLAWLECSQQEIHDVGHPQSRIQNRTSHPLRRPRQGRSRLGSRHPSASISEKVSSCVPFLALSHRGKAGLIRSWCYNKTNSHRALQSFASHCAPPGASIQRKSLTFQSEPTFGLERAREKPKVYVSL
jgi:hypothetical protein